ncbi:hypothetical protein ABT024_40885, partial [Streptomyces sp. NPDC002812]
GTVLLDETALWPDKKFVITNIIVSQKFLTSLLTATATSLGGVPDAVSSARPRPGACGGRPPPPCGVGAADPDRPSG